MARNIFIGIDCGFQGGITILGADKSPIVYHMPLMDIKKYRCKTVKTYDIEKIVEILGVYQNDNVVCGIEEQGGRPGEGSVSSRRIGEGYGILKGVAYTLLFKVIIVSPKKWKEHYSNLETSDITEMRESQSELRIRNKQILVEIEDIKE